MNPIELKKRDLGERLDLQSSQKHVFRLPGVSEAHVLEFNDAHFHKESAILLPDPEPARAGASGGERRVTGITLLASCYRYAEQNKDQSLLIVGHALSSEPDPPSLSQRRAENVRAALKGDRSDWVDGADEHHIVKDYQSILKWVYESRGWDCDPGPIDDILGPKTKAGVKSFQRIYNQAFGKSIAVDGIMGPQTWGAIFDMYMQALQNVLETDAEGLKAYRRMVHFIDPDCHAVGCGTAHPIPSKWASKYRSQTDRRVEAFFFRPGNEPRVSDPIQDPDTSPQVDIFDPLWYQFLFIPHSTSATIVEASVAIAEVEGLYKPGHDDGHDKLSGYKEGYKSEDDKGRIFINHKPITQASDDWQKAWEADTQYIELTVEVDPNPDTLPADARVVWEWEDPDDPSNEKMREDAGQYVDPPDYDQSGYAGPTEDDNQGQCDYPNPDSGSEAVFEEVDPYKLSKSGTRTCQTLVVNNESKVRLHCTNVGGDNYRVNVRLNSHPTIKVIDGDKTGAMTMWKRIDVEYHKMPNALELPVDEVPPYFENAFVQMDFTSPLHTPDQKYVAKTESEKGPKTSKLAKDGFDNVYKPGWFFLLSARGAVEDVETANSKVIYDSDDPDRYKNIFGGSSKGSLAKFASGHPNRIILDDFIPEKDKDGNDVDVAAIKLKENTVDGDREVLFSVKSIRRDPGRDKTEIAIHAIDYTSEFEPRNGRIGHYGYGRLVAYRYPRHTRFWQHTGSRWVDDLRSGGYKFPDSPVRIEVVTKGATYTSGRSPGDPSNSNFFVGRLIKFTEREREALERAKNAKKKAESNGDFKKAKKIKAKIKKFKKKIRESYISTIVHEFTHAFGLPHKCGFATYEDPADNSCAMNYFNTWLYAAETGHMYTVKRGDGGLQKIAREHDLHHWRNIYDHPKNSALRKKRPNPNVLQVGDTFWLPSSRDVRRFVTGKESNNLCPQHINGIRHMHLEDNPIMWHT